VIILDSDQVRRLMPMPEAVALMRTTFVTFSSGAVNQPVRLMVPGEDHDVLAVMPAHVRASPAAIGGSGLKVVSVRPDNPSLGQPAHVGMVMVFDPKTGSPAAMMSGAAVTALRTAAASAAATDALARPDASVLAILGAGVQARAHLEAISVVRPPSTVRIWNHQPEQFSSWARTRVPVPVQVCSSPAEAVDGADIICTTTAATQPLLSRSDVSAGAHINAVGSSFPTAREISGDLVGASRIVVDALSSARQESGDLLMAVREGFLDLDRVDTEIGQVLAGRSPGRHSSSDITLFVSLGLAVQDVMTGLVVHERAQAEGVGTQVDFRDV